MATTGSDSFAWRNEQIKISWCLNDIAGEIKNKFRKIKPSEENCRKVADLIECNHDADVGINWHTIDQAIRTCFPNSERQNGV